MTLGENDLLQMFAASLGLSPSHSLFCPLALDLLAVLQIMHARIILVMLATCHAVMVLLFVTTMKEISETSLGKIIIQISIT